MTRNWLTVIPPISEAMDSASEMETAETTEGEEHEYKP